MLIWILYVIFTPWIWLLYPTRIIGKKFVKSIKKQPYILSVNHQSNNDPIIIKDRLNKNLKIMAKDSLFRNKLVGGFLKKLGGYPVKRGGNDISAIKTTLKYLKEGKKLLIFPEGTRIKDGELAELKNGLVMFALKSDCYVIPAIFRKPTKMLRTNTLLIGKPFKFSEYSEFRDVKVDKDVLTNACQLLSEKMAYLKNVDIKKYKQEIKEK